MSSPPLNVSNQGDGWPLRGAPCHPVWLELLPRMCHPLQTRDRDAPQEEEKSDASPFPWEIPGKTLPSREQRLSRRGSDSDESVASVVVIKGADTSSTKSRGRGGPSIHGGYVGLRQAKKIVESALFPPDATMAPRPGLSAAAQANKRVRRNEELAVSAFWSRGA